MKWSCAVHLGLANKSKSKNRNLMEFVWKMLKMKIMKIDFPFNKGKYGSLQLSLSSGLLFFMSKVW